MPGWRKRQLTALVTVYYANFPSDSGIDERDGAAVHECTWSTDGEQEYPTEPIFYPDCTVEGQYQGYYRLAGNIPPEIFFLTALTYINLCCNQLSGHLPTQLGYLTALTFLGLRKN